VAEIGGDARPEGGFILPWPLDGEPGEAIVDGKPTRAATDGLHLAAQGRPITVRWRSAR
jgi:hypothetical protein